MQPEKTDNLARVRAWLVQTGLDGLIIPRTDAYQSEVTAPRDNCLEYVSGFTGSAGTALVLKDRALIFVDGRYQVQARNEVELSTFAVRHLHDDPLDLWLKGHAQSGWKIGIHTLLISSSEYQKLVSGCKGSGAQLVALDSDPFDDIWFHRPSKPVGAIRAVPASIAGETSMSKRTRIVHQMNEFDASLLVETMPDNIAWLLNLRGSDVPMNPVPHSYLLLDAHNQVEWFVDQRKLGNDLAEYELSNVIISDLEQFLDRLCKVAGGKNVLIDPEFAPQAVHARIESSGGDPIPRASIVARAKANKNAIELAGFRTCHREDGIALTNFLAWLDSEWHMRQSTTKRLTELEAEEQLAAFRARRSGYLEPSFRTISAAGSNAAMCHYSADPEANAAIVNNSFYLIDSGGQYLSGTTDVTRTILFGIADREMRETYTAVLKGFISLMTARFPIGTQGHQLDAFARRPLWDIGLDYDHGTGHSVGHNLLVHEHPHRFSKKANMHGLEPGQIMTIEPGYYKADAFGIRIENQVEIVEVDANFCRFKSLTLAPIDLRMAKIDCLSPMEIEFLDLYHAEVRSLLHDHVDQEAVPYLLWHTRPVAER